MGAAFPDKLEGQTAAIFGGMDSTGVRPLVLKQELLRILTQPQFLQAGHIQHQLSDAGAPQIKCPLAVVQQGQFTDEGDVYKRQGEAGRLAESMDDLFSLLVSCICWHDCCDTKQYVDSKTLEEYGQRQRNCNLEDMDIDSLQREMCIRDS